MIGLKKENIRLRKRSVLQHWVLCFLLAWGLNDIGFAQNLIPNPGFENAVECPTELGEVVIAYLHHWSPSQEKPLTKLVWAELLSTSEKDTPFNDYSCVGSNAYKEFGWAFFISDNFKFLQQGKT